VRTRVSSRIELQRRIVGDYRMSSLVGIGDSESMRNALCFLSCRTFASTMPIGYHTEFFGSQAPYPGSEYLSDPPIAHDNATKIIKALVLSPKL
jgi:hypothetical protein